jgi:putative pyrroloquinoline-quinone-binding quinoprotein
MRITRVDTPVRWDWRPRGVEGDKPTPSSRTPVPVNTLAVTLVVGALTAVLSHAQTRDWTTSGFDAQRTRWVRTDTRLTKAAVEANGLRFLWKATFDNETRQLHSLTQPILQDLLIGYRGFKSLAFIGGSADRLFSIDTDLGKPYWTTHLTYAASTGSVPGSTWECPGGLLATPSRRTALSPSTFGRGAGGRRGGRSFSAVGEPGQGAAVLKRIAESKSPPSDPPPPPPQAGARTIAPIPFGGVDPIFVMGSDGLLRTLRVSDGAMMEPPAAFLPPSTNPSSLVFVDGFVYTTTTNGCGAAPNALWALDTLSPEKKVTRWETGGANIVGTTGPALGADGTIFVALAPAITAWTSISHSGDRPPAVPDNALVALDRDTLTVKDWFAPAEGSFNAPPVVFSHGDREMIAITAGDGRLFLLDGLSLGGSDHRTPLHVTPPAGTPGPSPGLATWQDDTTRWIVAPIGDTIVAFTVSGTEGSAPVATRVWQTRPLVSPLAPIVVNDMVFVASSGEFRGEGAADPAKVRADRSSPAVLYALDGVTGKELWTSGTTITSFARAGLSAGNGQVYVVTYDNTLYAFGIPMEH